MTKAPTIRVERRGGDYVAFAVIPTPLGEQPFKELYIAIGTKAVVDLKGEIYLLKDTIAQLETKICRLKKAIGMKENKNAIKKPAQRTERASEEEK